MGGFHLEGMYPTPEEKRIFKEIIKLALDKKYEEAGKVAKTFPFGAGLRVGEC